MATIIASGKGGLWTSGSTWIGGVAPSSADNAQLSATSGGVIIDTGSVARSLDCTGYTGTLTHLSGATLSLGDSTPGTGNVALKLVAGMSYVLSNAVTSSITFVSTSATQQTITTAGFTMGAWDIQGGSYILSDSLTMGVSTQITLTAGSFSTGNQAVTIGGFFSSNTNVRSLSFGSSIITLNGNVQQCLELLTITNLTFNAGTSSVTCVGGHPGGLAFYDMTIIVSGAFNGINSLGAGPDLPSLGVGLTGPQNSFRNLTITGPAAKNGAWHIATPLRVTGILTINGNSAINRLLIWSGGYTNMLGYPALIDYTGGSISVSNVDFKDIQLTPAVDLSAASGRTGDCGGNIGITATAPVTRTWTKQATGSWSDPTCWTGGLIPIPQDSATFTTFTATGQTVTCDMPRMCKNFTATSATNNPTFTYPQDVTIFGNMTWGASQTHTLTTSRNINLEARSAASVTRSAKTFSANIVVTAPGGTITFTDASSCNRLVFNQGALIFNNTLSTTFINFGVYTETRSITIASAWTFSSGGAVWLPPVSGFSLTATGSTMTLNSATAKTFTGASLTYGALVFSGGDLTLIGNASFSDIQAPSGGSLTGTSGTVQTITGTWASAFANGTNLVSIQSTIPGSPFIISKASGAVVGDYMSLRDSTASGGATFNPGVNSGNGGGVIGWVFTYTYHSLGAIQALLLG